jgi:hypothetical protein
MIRNTIFALSLFLVCSLEITDQARAQLTATHVGPAQQAYGCWFVGGEYFLSSQSGFYKSNDGVNWISIHAFGQNGASMVVLPTHEIFLFHYDDYEVSTDDGATWKKTTQSGFSTRMVIADSLGNMYAGQNDPVYISKDKGKNWTKQNPGASPNFFDISIIKVGRDGSIYAANQGITGGMAYRSTDQGAHWKLLHMENMSDVVDLDVYPNGTVILWYADKVLRSDDNGKTWDQVADPKAEEYPKKAAFVSADEGYALAGQGRIVRTTDGGVSWDSSIAYSAVSGFTDLSSVAGHLFGETPQGLYSLSATASVNVSRSQMAVSVFPNPATDKLVISPVGGVRTMQYSLLDVNGKKIAEGQVNEGASTVSLVGLPAGTYYLVTSCEGMSTIRSFVHR